MKKLPVIFVLTVWAALAGCGSAAREIRAGSQGMKTNVFTEVSHGGPIPRGFSELAIKADIKTHLEGYYVGESGRSLHGKPGYPFVINIDGQGVQWKAEGVRDAKPAYEADGRTSLDPEAGEGIRYVLQKRVRLAAGPHRVYFGLPEEDYQLEVEIALSEGAAHVLEFRPVYRTKDIPVRMPTFLRGVSRYEAVLDGAEIR